MRRVRREPRGTVRMARVPKRDMPRDERRAVRRRCNAVPGEHRHQAPLHRADGALDLALGLRRRRHTVRDAQRAQHPPALGHRVNSLAAEHRETVGVQAFGDAVAFKRRAQVLEVRPQRLARPHADVEDFAGVVVDRHDHALGVFGIPEFDGCGVVLPEFAGVGALPAPAWLFGRWRACDVMRKHPRHVRPDGGARALEMERARQLVGHERVVAFALSERGFEQVVGFFGPRFFVVSAGASGCELAFVSEPFRAQLIKPHVFDAQLLTRLLCVDFTGVEAFQNGRNQRGRTTFQKLLFFMAVILHEKHPSWPVILGRFSLK